MLLVQNDCAWWLVSIPVESTSGFHKLKERIYRWKLGMQRVIQNATYFIDTRVRTRNSKDIPVTQRCCKAPLPVRNVGITYNPFRYPYKWVTEAITLHVSLVVLFFSRQEIQQYNKQLFEIFQQFAWAVAVTRPQDEANLWAFTRWQLPDTPKKNGANCCFQEWYDWVCHMWLQIDFNNIFFAWVVYG